MGKNFLYVILIVAGLAASVIGQTSAFDDGQLTISEAIVIAETSNPAIRQMEQQVAAARAQIWSGFGLDSPMLQYAREGIPSGAGGYQEQRWSVQQDIDFPLTTYFRLRRLSSRQNALKESLASAKRQLKADVKNAYTEVAYRLRLLDFERKKMTIAEDLRDVVRVRVDIGESSSLEQLNADIQFAEAQNDFEQAENELHKARYQLFTMMGIEPGDHHYGVIFSDSLTYFESDIDQQSAIRQLEMHPRYRAAQRREAAAEWQERESWSGFLPNFTFGFFRQDFGSGYDFSGFEIGVDIPLWFFLNNRGEVQAARANRQAQKWQKQEVSLQLREAIERSWHHYDTSRKNIRRYQNTIRGQAEKLFALTLEGYRMGEIDMLTLIEAQRTYINSQQKYYLALKTYYQQLIELERFLDDDLVYVRP